jgi:hypothetical protein
MGAAFTMPYDPAMNAIQRPRRRDIDNSASARIPFGVFDLRPEAIVGLDDVFLAIDPSHVGGTIRVECAATSKNVGGVYRQTIGHAVAVEAAIPVVKAPGTRP